MARRQILVDFLRINSFPWSIFYMFSKVFHQKAKIWVMFFFQTMVLRYVITTSQTQTWPWTYVNSVQEMHTFNVAGKLNLLQMHEGQLSKIYWVFEVTKTMPTSIGLKKNYSMVILTKKFSTNMRNSGKKLPKGKK